MPGENGIEAAAEIRKYDKNVKIIFVTSSSEFAVQSYVIGALKKYKCQVQNCDWHFHF